MVFAELAVTRCPLTVDHDMLSLLLEQVDFAPRDQQGTALGMGLCKARWNRGMIQPEWRGRLSRRRGAWLAKWACQRMRRPLR